MMQQRPQQQQGNWGGNPAWGNQGGQGKQNLYRALVSIILRNYLLKN